MASYAVFSEEARRQYPEEKSDTRTDFQRDAQRIYHAAAFRRMQGKRQVLPVSTNDHIRTRLTHTLEVAQIARSLARMNCLNEDLTEAIALAHDLGHPPFAHVGEWALDEVLKRNDSGFEHNEQSVRVVTKLEKKSDLYPGLNLTTEVLEGLDKHRSFFPNSRNQSSLEAQIVNVADRIAYHSHDLEDALQNKIIQPDELSELRIWQVLGNLVEEGARPLQLAGAVINFLILDLNREMQNKLKAEKIRSSEEIKNAPQKIAVFSEKVDIIQEELGEFLEENYYHSSRAEKENEKASWQMTELVERLLEVPELLPKNERDKLQTEELTTVVRDYVSGMTDLFAVQELRRISE